MHKQKLETLARRFMRKHRFAFMDPATEQVSAVVMAEETAKHFSIYEDNGFDVAEWLFDLAAEIAFK